MPLDPDTLQEDFTLLVPPQLSPVEAVSADAPLAVNYGPMLIALAVLIAGWIVLRWWRSRGTRPAEPPEVVALRELERWQSSLPESQYREAVAAVSGTVRRYVEGRFGLHAPTLTTEEFWAEQRAHRRIPDTYDPFWTEFLDTCDPIKYAGAHPQAPEFQALIHASVGFVKASSGRSRRLAA